MGLTGRTSHTDFKRRVPGFRILCPVVQLSSLPVQPGAKCEVKRRAG